MRLLLVRHAATQQNAEARYTGQGEEPLSALGLRQAEALAACLAQLEVDTLVTSDLLRARDTTAAIARFHDVPVWVDPDLREVAMGEWEGASYEELAARDGDRLKAWKRGDATVAPPGGETLAEVRTRAAAALRRWQARYPQGTQLWVTHSGFLSVLLCHLLGLPLEERRRFRCANASITDVELEGTAATLVCLNATLHLRGL